MKSNDKMNPDFKKRLIEKLGQWGNERITIGLGWRRLADLNRRITVLQTVALPLG